MNASDLADLDPFGLLDIESARLDRFFSALHEEEWSKPTRHKGWSVRDVLAHLAGSEVYNKACLDGEPERIFAKPGVAGGTGFNGFNESMVTERAAKPVAEVLGEWRNRSAETRARLRERGLDGELLTLVGPYPAGLQSFHLASKAATHADDLDAPVEPGERAGRVAWRARFTRFALKEKDLAVALHSEAGKNRLRLGDQEALLSDEEFVKAAVARLPDDHPLSSQLRAALHCLA